MVSAMLGDSLTMIAATFTTELSNIDSRTSTGAQHRFKTPFDNCAFAGQRTVLQHIPPRRMQTCRYVARRVAAVCRRAAISRPRTPKVQAASLFWSAWSTSGCLPRPVMVDSHASRLDVPVPAKQFQLVLIKPSHYDDDGYVIRWWRAMIPSNSLAAIYGIAVDCAERALRNRPRCR